MVEQQDDIQAQVDDLKTRVEDLEAFDGVEWQRRHYVALAKDILGNDWAALDDVFALADRIAAYCNKKG